MAVNTMGNDLEVEQVKLKKYFYALRPALACLWIITFREIPPMEFEELRILITDNCVQAGIDELLQRKQVAGEKTLIEPEREIDKWLFEVVEKCRSQITLLPSKRYTPEELDPLFRKYIL